MDHQQLSLFQDSRVERFPEQTEAEALELLVQLIISATSYNEELSSNEQDHE